MPSPVCLWKQLVASSPPWLQSGWVFVCMHSLCICKCSAKETWSYKMKEQLGKLHNTLTRRPHLFNYNYQQTTWEGRLEVADQKKSPLISAVNRRKDCKKKKGSSHLRRIRLQFAEKYATWTFGQCRKVSNLSLFCSSHFDIERERKKHVWRADETRFLEDNMNPVCAAGFLIAFLNVPSHLEFQWRTNPLLMSDECEHCVALLGGKCRWQCQVFLATPVKFSMALTV
eukprot:TRINITY_DN2411_c0_g1_i1.p1 TRINITY_DN2411_c0_g1~~TRINITY_DN2411_c0_g1_i1.p1  ORF type:complete len:228 (+),score=26.56 TRINITY_DN2411_c0_g1_i1:52-735(+)